jgi:hypothetical protein
MVTDCTFREVGERQWQCPACGFVAKSSTPNIHRRCSPIVGKPPCGPGCHLKRLLGWVRIKDDGSCGCSDYAADMDAWGPDGCDARMDEIVAHLVEQAAKRSVVLGLVPARIVTEAVRRAINAARKEASHGKATTQEEAPADVGRD